MFEQKNKKQLVSPRLVTSAEFFVCYCNFRGISTYVRDAANNVSSATYDLLGNVTRLAGPLGGATNYTYDDMGRLVSESTVSGGTKSYEYNELNLRQSLTNARGQKRKLFYNALGRITGYISPEDSVSYTYDANGNILTVIDNKGTITRTYDALNRVLSYTDTYGKVIRYEYDAVGNLSKLIYPDNTAVTYAYDANHNLVRVTDWANRVTSYTYDENNRVIGVNKPDGSVTTTVYDNKQRVISTVEKTASGTVITGFEYTYDDLSRIVEEKILANSTKMCYTYDSLSRVTKRTVYNECNEIVSEENFTYDAAGNITDAPNSCFAYDTNNRLVVFNGNSVNYDLDGNMLSNGSLTCTYDSANRLIKAGGHTYTYNAEDVRIRNLCNGEDTTYTYNTNAKLSMLLMKTTNGVVTKYVYGRGLIGEEVGSAFKTYQFDSRGSTVAITDMVGNISDTFAYDTYGKLLSRTGTSKVIFGYNGRDGVVTDDNGLIYMRTRYYSPAMKRFVNADIIPGEISDSTSLNRYAYVGGNPITFIDPTGYIGILTLMLIGAGIGTVIGAIGSVASQKIESKINNEEFELDVRELAADMVWGAIDGAVSFSLLGPAGMAIAEAATSVGSSLTDELIDDEEGVNITRMGKSIAFDMALGKIGVDFTGEKNVAKALEATKDSAVKLAKRKNQKWAKKQIARQAKDFNYSLNFKIYEDTFNGLIGIGINSAFRKVDYALDGYINLPDYLDDGIVISRK